MKTVLKDRLEAGHLLSERLAKFTKTDGLVLAIPRGGVPIAYEIAKDLELPLEIILTKKIGHPNHPESAIGAVSLNDRILEEYKDVPGLYIAEETARLRRELKEKQALYTGNRKPFDVRNKTIILTDDGIATGKTILLTIKFLRSQQPKAIILAIPVMPDEMVKEVVKQVDELVYIMTPSDFKSVNQFYEHFNQVSDEEVVLLLNNIVNKKTKTVLQNQHAD
jgi:putative phosphoribosyl transferase